MQSSTPAPQVNWRADLYQQPRQIQAPITTISGPLFDQCVSYTKEHGKFIFDPKFSLFLTGLRCMNHPQSSWPLQGLERLFGFFLTCASPVLGTIITAQEAPPTVAGALGTVALAPVVGVELGARKAVQVAQTLSQPNEADSKRRHFTQLFIDRMRTIINQAPHFEQNRIQMYEIIKNPLALIGHAALQIAFMSRLEPCPTALKVGSHVLHRQAIYDLPQLCKTFFDALCIMKQTIQQLQLDQSSDLQAWKELSQYIEHLRANDRNAVLISNEEIGEWVDLGSSSQKVTSAQEENVTTLLGCMYAFSSHLSQDPIFNELWQKSYQHR